MGKAMSMRLNISIETTGSFSFPDWLFKEPKLQPYISEYDIVFVFPIVSCSVAWSRYKSRPIKSYLSRGSFRFGSTRTGFTQQYIKSYKAFLEKMPALMSGNPITYVIVPNDPSNTGNNAKRSDRLSIPPMDDQQTRDRLQKKIDDAEQFKLAGSK